jgi:hypothetical protein
LAVELQADDVRALADIGFLALSRGLDKQAMAIFAGVKAARPEQEAGPLGIALVHMLRGELDIAVRMLRALPPSDTALTFLGMALARQGQVDEARGLLEEVAATAADTAAGKLARETLASIAS